MPQPICFACGQLVGEPHRLNRLDNGQICPTCRDRVLDSLPPILPALPRVRTPDVPTQVDPLDEDSEDPPAAS